jgi:hypothetical protein
MRELYGRSSVNGDIQTDHYVFPACENQRFDPTTPQKSWRSARRSLRKAAGIAALRFHDLRHHAITELAESQASDATITAIAGHVSRQMLEHYSHVRLSLKRKALDGLASRGGDSEGKPTGYDTNSDTRTPSPEDDHDLSYRKNWSGREDLNLRPPGPELGGRGGNFVAVQSFEWCFNRLSLAESRQFGRNVNPPIATLARVSFHLGS